MTRRLPRISIALVTVLGALAMAPSVRAQAVVVTAKSAGELIDDLRYLLAAVGSDGDDIQPALQGLDQLKAPGLLKGLDLTRPIGAFADLPAQPGEPPAAVAFIPVTDGKAFLDTLAQQFKCGVSDQPGVPGFSHKLTLPMDGAPPLLVVLTKEYAFFSLAPTGADKLKTIKPASLMPKTVSDLALSLRLDRVPEPLKQQIIAQSEEGMKAQGEQRPGENDEAYKGRILGQKVAQEVFSRLLKEGKELAMSLVVEPKRNDVAVELSVNAVAGTQLDKSLRAVGSKRSLFHSLGKGTVMTAWANVPVPEPMRDLIAEGLEKARAEGEQKADTPEAKQTLNDLAAAVKPTVSADEIDLGLSVFGPFPKPKSKPTYVLLWGIKLADGLRIEKLFRDMVAKADPDNKARISLDVAKATADSPAIHRIKIDADKNLDDFGDPSVFLSFRKDAGLVALGENGLAVLKQAIDLTRRPAAGASAPAEAEIALAKLVPLIEDDDNIGEAGQQAANKVFVGKDENKDKLRLTLRGEADVLRLRLTTDVPALRYFVVTGGQQKKKPTP
ncbi:MAG TPA: hypothetical protein VGZ22_30350 [Isosphaeraceae bacterium]|jgi:hypothetical protein|nr:hypothetical protein [Isosphaeraceae bacterium]